MKYFLPLPITSVLAQPPLAAPPTKSRQAVPAGLLTWLLALLPLLAAAHLPATLAGKAAAGSRREDAVRAVPVISNIAPSSQPVGGVITLDGTDLTGATAITFTGTSGNVVTTGFTVNGAGTRITGIVVPSGAQTGTLTVTTPGGTSAASSQTFTVCRITVLVQAQTLTLDATGAGSITAGAFDAGSSSTCGGLLTPNLIRSGIAYGQVAENATLTLTAPAGTTFTGVLFASYGTPTGSNGSYVQSSCHAATSRSVAEAALLGKTGTVTIPATNTVFSDPCNGIVKSLAVAAVYTASSPSATLSYSCADIGTQPVVFTLTDIYGTTASVATSVTINGPPAATLSSLSPATALAGQTVTATGTNLSQATALTVNGAAASISGLTATGFTFVVPAAATGTGNVVVTVPCQNPSLPFTVPPAISSFTPASGPVGTTVTLTGANLTGTTAITFTGARGNVVSGGFTVNAAGTQITGIVVPAGAQTGTLTVTTPGGTSAASSQSFAVCEVLANVQNQALTLSAAGAGSIAAAAFDAGSSSTCGAPPTVTARKGGRAYGVVGEGGTLALTAPVGYVFSEVLFASYGTPTGSAGSYAQSGCHAPTSRSVVEAALLGQTGTVNIAAANGVFGDPCSGTVKRLAVTAVYLYVGSSITSSATLAYGCAEVGTQPVLLSLTDASGTVTLAQASLTVSGPPAATLGSVSPSAAPPGQVVTVTGTNLSGATALTVNGAAVAINGLTATGFTFVVPSVTPATGTLALALPCGQSLTQPFTVSAPPVPTLTALSSAAELPGQTITLTGTGFAPASSVSIGGTAAGSVTFVSATTLTAVVPVGATVGFGAVTVTTAGGSASTGATDFEVLQVYRSSAASGCLSTTAVTFNNSGKWRYLRLPGGGVVAAVEDTYPLGSVTADVQMLGTGSPPTVRQDGKGQRYLDRNFHLNADNKTFTGSSVRVRFYGLSTELSRLASVDAAVTLASLKVSQYSGTSENCDLADNSTAGQSRLLAAPATAVDDWFVAQVTVPDHFSEFYLTGASTPLPVELTTFTAQAEGAAARLRWTTATEKNSARFEVERSADGQTFARVGEVAAQGTSTHATTYTFLDEKSTPSLSHAGTIYYRLRQVDQDGTFGYSPVRTVTPSLRHQFTLYPNPAHGVVTVAGLAAGAQVQVLDALGRLRLMATAAADGTAALTLPAGLAAGVYVVRSSGQALRLAVE